VTRAFVLALLVLAGCAPRFKPGEYGRLGKSPVECRQDPDGARTRVQCCVPGDPRTCKAVLVGDTGPALEGVLRGGATAK
jgi:hypothetical protein